MRYRWITISMRSCVKVDEGPLKRNAMIRGLLAAILLVFIAALYAVPGQAATNTWTNGQGDYNWFQSSNWSEAHVPTSSEPVHIHAHSDWSHFVTINNAGQMAYAENLQLGTNRNDASYLDVYTNLTVTNYIKVSDEGFGIIRQWSGTVQLGNNNDLTLSDQSLGSNVGSGTYGLYGGVLKMSSTGNIYVGGKEVGVLGRFDWGAGEFESSNRPTMVFSTAATGTLGMKRNFEMNDLVNGTMVPTQNLSSANLEISGGATVTHTSVNATFNQVIIGEYWWGQGTYNLNGGSLTSVQPMYWQRQHGNCHPDGWDPKLREQPLSREYCLYQWRWICGGPWDLPSQRRDSQCW